MEDTIWRILCTTLSTGLLSPEGYHMEDTTWRTPYGGSYVLHLVLVYYLPRGTPLESGIELDSYLILNTTQHILPL